jgi:predicted acylesterase/phospholipase RssA
LLPRIIAGSSAGSIVAAFIATTRLEELKNIWENEGVISFECFKKKNENGTFLRRL